MASLQLVRQGALVLIQERGLQETKGRLLAFVC